MRKFLFPAVFSLLLASSALTTRAETRFATPSTGIQAVVDMSGPHDTIMIASGCYHESVNIIPDKYDLQLVGDGGVIIDGTTTNPNVFLTVGIFIGSTSVTVRGLTVQNFIFGIDLEGTGGNTVRNCNLINNAFGINCSTGTEESNSSAPAPTVFDDNVVTNSTTSSSSSIGIFLTECQNVTVSHCQVYCNGTGIQVTSASIECKISHNDVFNNTGSGIQVETGCHDNLITQNTVFGNHPNMSPDASDGTDPNSTNFWTHNTVGQ
jgi:parallel beta-helix repeat protein